MDPYNEHSTAKQKGHPQRHDYVFPQIFSTTKQALKTIGFYQAPNATI